MTAKLFASNHFEDEIYRSMEKTLVSNQVENKHGFNKLAKAVDFLNEAAAIFEQAGMYKEAAEVTKVLQSLAKDLQ
jgi:hypothetical protein